MTKDTHYYSDWIENTGTMPVGITNETVLEVVYIDGHEQQEKCWASDLWWTRGDNYTDIDMYRYVYDTVAVAQESSVFALDELNLFGIDPKSTAFGIRAKVNVTLQDFADTDTWLDKYQADLVAGAALFSGVGYNPMDRKRFLAFADLPLAREARE